MFGGLLRFLSSIGFAISAFSFSEFAYPNSFLVGGMLGYCFLIVTFVMGRR